MVQVPDTILPHKGSLSEDVMITTVGFVESRVLNSQSGLSVYIQWPWNGSPSVSLVPFFSELLWNICHCCWFQVLVQSGLSFECPTLFKSHRAWAGMLVVSSWPMLLIMENVLMLFGLIQSMIFVYEIFAKSPGKAFLLPNTCSIFWFLIPFSLKQLFGPEFWVGNGSFIGYNDRYHETSFVTPLT